MLGVTLEGAHRVVALSPVLLDTIPLCIKFLPRPLISLGSIIGRKKKINNGLSAAASQRKGDGVNKEQKPTIFPVAAILALKSTNSSLRPREVSRGARRWLAGTTAGRPVPSDRDLAHPSTRGF